MHPALRRALVVPSLAVSLAAGMLLAGSPAHAADRDCGDFASQKAAQLFFLDNGGPDSDPHRLDADGDGVSCESNPAPYHYGVTVPEGGSPSKPAVIRQRAKVVRVVDGDTVEVRLANGRRRSVRLLGTDTPEVYGGVECGGLKASRSMRRLTPRGTPVVLVSDPTQDRVDRYGRLLRYVMKSGRDMNRVQVRRGWARVYVYAGSPFQRVSGYRESQRAARTAPRGVWKVCR
jgi:endonuclease YncB( thermonuclease family)